jgi:hypothetical protein
MPVPRWIRYVSGAIALLGLFVGGSLYVAPAKFVPNVDFAATGANYLARMWAARQIAIAAIIGYALFRRSAVMLQVALIAYCLMTLQDAVIGISSGDPGVIIGSAVAGLLSASMIVVLSKRNSKELSS